MEYTEQFVEKVKALSTEERQFMRRAMLTIINQIFVDHSEGKLRECVTEAFYYNFLMIDTAIRDIERADKSEALSLHERALRGDRLAIRELICTDSEFVVPINLCS